MVDGIGRTAWSIERRSCLRFAGIVRRVVAGHRRG